MKEEARKRKPVDNKFSVKDDDTMEDKSVNKNLSKNRKLDSDGSVTFKEAGKIVTNWTFKARVTNKSEIKNFAKGNLFTFDLLDSSGEVRCVVYHPLVELFFEKVIVDKVYLFSNVLLKATDKKFNHFDNLFELNLYESSTIIECSDNLLDIPLFHYNFKNLMNLSDCKRNDIIDVIGIVTNIGPIEDVSNAKGVNFIKREVVLSDELENTVTLVFWNTAATNFDKKMNSILIIKGGKINDFNNIIKLSIIQSTYVKEDVSDVPEGNRLLEYLNKKVK